MEAATSTSSSSGGLVAPGTSQSVGSRGAAASSAATTMTPARPAHHRAEQLAMGLSILATQADALMLASDTSQASVHHVVAGAGVPPPVETPLLGGWEGMPDGRGTLQRGPTFFLSRSARDASTEGVLAPTWLLEQGISNMLDLAEAFDDAEEVRAAFGAAAQT